MPLTTTLSLLHVHFPYSSGWKKLFLSLGKTAPDNEPLPIEVILDLNGLDDSLRVLRAVDGHRGAMRLYACYCARRVLPIYEEKHPDDMRPRKAIEAAEGFAHGKVSDKELAAAATDARFATMSVELDASLNTALGTPWDASFAAAFFAAKATSAAAWYASRDDAQVDVRNAVWHAAQASTKRDALRADFTAEFRRLCRLVGKYGGV